MFNKIIFDYQILNEKNELLAVANTILVFVNKETFKPIKCPDFLLEKFNSITK